MAKPDFERITVELNSILDAYAECQKMIDSTHETFPLVDQALSAELKVDQIQLNLQRRQTEMSLEMVKLLKELFKLLPDK